MSPHERLAEEIVVQQPGFVYIYLSNDNEEPLEVFFDDFTVTHSHSAIVQADDYYPFGMEISDLSYKRENSSLNNFRFQSDFSEKDELTGWNSFYLRNYDSQIGRWTSVDPYDQYPSPYMGMGNDPINTIDPDGGWSWVGALVGAVLGGTSAYYASDGDLGWTIAGAAGGAVAGGFIGSAFDGAPGSVKDASGWDRLRARLGEGQLTTSGRYKVARSIGKLNYPEFSGWLEKTFYLDIDTYGLSAVTHSFRSLSFRFNAKLTKELNFTVNSAKSIFSLERNGFEIFSNEFDRTRLYTPNFKNRGESFTPVITHSFPPIEYEEVTEGFLAQVHVTGLYRTVKVQRRVHRINRALIENRVKTGKYIGSWRIIE